MIGIALAVAALLLAIALLGVEVLRLRRRVAQLERGREVVGRHIDHLAWRLDGEPRDDGREWHPVWQPQRRARP